MDENLKSAVSKMGMSDCPTGLNMSIDLILKNSPESLDNIEKNFDLNEDEVKAFKEYLEKRKEI